MTSDAEATRRRSRRSTALFLTLGLVALAALLALGSWQVQRLHWKEALIASIESRIASEPLPLAEIERMAAAGEDVDYRPAMVEGRFLHRAERHLLATHEGQSGWHVYTPMQLADGRYLFVNRGFVPYDRKDAATRAEGQVGGVTRVEGLARAALSDKPSFIVPDNDPAQNQFYWKDIDAMARSADLPADAKVLPFFLDAGPAPNPGRLPVGGVTIVSLPNNHLQYAVTWYGLALVLAAVMTVWLLRRRKA